MKSLYKPYNRYLIAILLMTIMYGRPLVCAVYKIVTIQAIKSVASQDLPAEEGNENEDAQESTIKEGKKSWLETTPCLAPLSAHLSSVGHNSLWPLTHIDLIESYYQKVPTPPPLRHLA